MQLPDKLRFGLPLVPHALGGPVELTATPLHRPSAGSIPNPAPDVNPKTPTAEPGGPYSAFISGGIMAVRTVSGASACI